MTAFRFSLSALAWLWLCAFASAQTINPPADIRQANYGPSCAHAATITMLRWQGLDAMADWWRESYRGPETFTGLARKAIVAKLDYAMLLNGDTAILDHATATRRGAVIDWSGQRGGHHAVFFCGFAGNTATICDPNTRRLHPFERSAFLTHWRRCGGRSLMTLYDPKF